MEKIQVLLIYPVDFKLDDKEIELTEFEFQVMMKCNKIGSEGKYFEVEEMYFEDTERGNNLSIVLK